MAKRYRLLVIGTGTAAIVAATQVRQAGWSVAVVDHRPFGGTCALRGCDPKKVLMGGAVYRLVTNVLSNGADPSVRYAVLPHALPPPAYADGWHAGVALDYPTTLDVHNDAFTAFSMNELVAKIGAEVHAG